MPKIKDVKVIPASIPYEDEPPSEFIESWGTQLYVKLELDEFVGYGEVLVYGSGIVDSYLGVFENAIIPSLLGKEIESSKDIVDIVQILQKLLFTAGLCGVVNGAIGGIEMALWDAISRFKKLPLSNMLGRPVRSSIPVYASFPRYSSTDLVIKAVEKALSQGFDMIKLHQDALSTKECLKAIRKDFGFDLKVACDLNASLTFGKAVDFIKEIEKYEPFWIEEPVWPPNDHKTLRKVAKNAPIPIVAGENEYQIYGFRELANSDLKYVQPDISKVGGINSFLYITSYLLKRNKLVAPHLRPHRSILAHVYTLQLASLIQDIFTVEWPLASVPDGVFSVKVPVKDGQANISDILKRVGVGIEIDESYLLSKYRYTKKFRPLQFH